jgi:hypothetical protein
MNRMTHYRTVFTLAVLTASAIVLHAQDNFTRNLLIRGTNTVPANIGTLTVTTLTAPQVYTLPNYSGPILVSNAPLNPNAALRTNGSGEIETVTMADGQLLIGSSSATPVVGSIAGTANQVNVTPGAGTITLSLPQDIHNAAQPTFAGAILQGTTFINTVGSATTDIGNVSGGNVTVSVNAGTSDLILNGIPVVAPIQDLLWITAANEVRRSPFSGTALEGVEFHGSAYRLGGQTNTTNPLISTRFVNVDNQVLNFTVSGGSNNLVQISGGTQTVGIGNTANANYTLSTTRTVSGGAVQGALLGTGVNNLGSATAAVGVTGRATTDGSFAYGVDGRAVYNGAYAGGLDVTRAMSGVLGSADNGGANVTAIGGQFSSLAVAGDALNIGSMNYADGSTSGINVGVVASGGVPVATLASAVSALNSTYDNVGAYVRSGGSNDVALLLRANGEGARIDATGVGMVIGETTFPVNGIELGASTFGMLIGGGAFTSPITGVSIDATSVGINVMNATVSFSGSGNTIFGTSHTNTHDVLGTFNVNTSNSSPANINLGTSSQANVTTIGHSTASNTTTINSPVVNLTNIPVGTSNEFIVRNGSALERRTINNIVTGTGTANRLTRWTGTNTIGDASLDDDGSGVLSRAGNIALNPGAGNTLSTNGSLTVGVDATITGNLTANGNTSLGDADADVTTIRGAINLNTTNSAAATVNIGTSAFANTTTIGSNTVSNTTTINSPVVNLTNIPVGTSNEFIVRNGSALERRTINDIVTGTGTANRLTRWTGTNTVGDASLDDNGSGVLSRAGNIAINPGAVNTLSTNGSLSVSVNATITGNLTVNGNTTLGDAATDGITLTGEILGASPLRFEGATNDNVYTTFNITDPTAARTITFPNASGTVALINPSAVGVVEYGVTAGQNSVPSDGTYRLFNVSYSSTVTGNALGGLITSTSTPLAGAQATGLTVNASGNANTSGVIVNAISQSATSFGITVNSSVTGGAATTAYGVRSNVSGGATTTNVGYDAVVNGSSASTNMGIQLNVSNATTDNWALRAINGNIRLEPATLPLSTLSNLNTGALDVVYWNNSTRLLEVLPPSVGRTLLYAPSGTQDGQVANGSTFLFDIAYSGVPTGHASGGRIASSASAFAGGNATGLTVEAVANATGTGTALSLSATGGSTNYALDVTAGTIRVAASSLPTAVDMTNRQVAIYNTSTNILERATVATVLGGNPVLYGPSAQQSTVGTGSTHLLDVAYSGTVTGEPVGARITSTAVDPNTSATALTLSSTATGTGVARALDVTSGGVRLSSTSTTQFVTPVLAAVGAAGVNPTATYMEFDMADPGAGAYVANLGAGVNGQIIYLRVTKPVYASGNNITFNVGGTVVISASGSDPAFTRVVHAIYSGGAWVVLSNVAP